MTTSRFDAKEAAPYGTCVDCNMELATESLAREHMDSTFEQAHAEGGSSGHSARVTNPTRAHRIGNEIELLIDDAVREVSDKLDELVEDGHVTREEATTALARWSHFADHWREEGLDRSINDEAVAA